MSKGTEERLYKQWKENPLSLDSKIRFDQSVCLTCNGRCCINPGVILTPYDLYRLAKGQAFQRIGKGFKEFLKDCCEVYIGDNSKIPIVLLGVNELGMCWFLAPVLHKRNGKLIPLTNPEGNMLKLCSVNDCKPMKCRFYPLGHVMEGSVSDSETKSGFVYLKGNICPSCSGGIKTTVREILGEDLESLRFTEKCSKVIAKASEFMLKEYPELVRKELEKVLFETLYVLPVLGAEGGKTFEEIASTQEAFIDTLSTGLDKILIKLATQK